MTPGSLASVVGKEIAIQDLGFNNSEKERKSGKNDGTLQIEVERLAANDSIAARLRYGSIPACFVCW